MKTFIGGLATYFAAKKIFDFGVQAVEDAAQVQKSTEAIRANFGKSSDAIVKFNENAASSFGISNQAGTAFAAQMGLVATNLNLSQKQGAGMTIGLEKLAGAFGLIKGQDPSTVFGKLQKALLGNTRGLKDMGIAITPFAEKQEALTLGIKRQSSQWNANEKAQIIYGIAMKHLPELMDQAKKHSGDLADSQIKLSAQWSNLKEKIGAELLPVLTRLATWITKNTSTIADIAIGVAGVAVAFAAYSAAAAIATIATEGFTAALLANPVGLIAVGVVALGVAVVIAYRHFATFRTIVQGALHAAAAAIDFVKAHWHLFLLLIPGVGIALAIVASHFGTFKQVASAAIDAVKVVVNSLRGPLARIASVVAIVAGQVASDFGKIVGSIKTVISWVQSLISWIAKIPNITGPSTGANPQTGQGPGGQGRKTYASGGPVAPWQSYLVGERGPELFMSRVAGTIIPNDKLGMGAMALDVAVYLDGHRIDDRVEAKFRKSTKAAQAGRRWPS
jgi:hypothetical protein